MENYLQNYKSYIYNAILKYGHSNFELSILEYCSSDKCIEREDYYLSSLPHEYNILEKAGSRLGSKHSDDTKQIMSDAAKKIDHPGRFKTGENHPNFGKKVEGSGKPSQQIEVTDIKNNQATTYDSINEAAKALNLPSHSIISNYIQRNQKKPYKGRYNFKKV
jgi:group I intron endonuclease